MSKLAWLVKGLVAAMLLVSLASCCCLGGTDDDDDDFNPIPHNEGTGGDA
jgi:hypothetical protein